MIDLFLSTLASWIVTLISAAGYIGIAILMAIESACVPLPSEIIMPFAGSLVATGRLSLIGVAIAGAVGCSLGSTIAYLIGAWGGQKGIEKWGRYVLIRPTEVHAAEQFFARFGAAAVFFGRLLPIVRTFIALPAGVARMPMLKFQIYTFLGSLPWCFGLAYIGARLGERWNSDPAFRSLFHRFNFAVGVVILIGLAWFIWARFRKAAA